MQAYELLVGLAYPTDTLVDESLRKLGEDATAARAQAAATHDPRDIDAADLAEQARQEAVGQALSSGALKDVPKGTIVTDIPSKSVPWLLEQGLIREVARVEKSAEHVPDVPASKPARVVKKGTDS